MAYLFYSGNKKPGTVTKLKVRATKTYVREYEIDMTEFEGSTPERMLSIEANMPMEHRGRHHGSNQRLLQ